jgi:hypothetical protein
MKSDQPIRFLESFQLASSGFGVKSVSRSAWQAWESVTVVPCLTKDRLLIHLLHRQACLVGFYYTISFIFSISFRILKICILILLLNYEF